MVAYFQHPLSERPALARGIRVALFVALAAIAVTGCGGSDNTTPASCEAPQPLPVRKFSYPNGSVRIGENVSLAPILDVTTGSLANAVLRFDLVAGPLPGGLRLDSNSGRISGIVGAPAGVFPFTVRVSADCFTDPVTTSAVFSVD